MSWRAPDGTNAASPTASSTGRPSTPPRRPARCSPRVSRCTFATGTRSRATCTRTLRPRNSGLRTLLTLPMRRHAEVIGAITFIREAPGGYDAAEQSLLQAFTDQAAIAVDNARLLQEIEQRNNELAESLELQTATSDILELISVESRRPDHGPPGHRCTRCGVVRRRRRVGPAPPRRHPAHRGRDRTLGGSAESRRPRVRRRADHQPPGAGLTRNPSSSTTSRTCATPWASRVAQDVPDLHSFATIALLLDGEWIGSLNLSRTEVRPFDPKVAPIMQAFADQAAIAVANAKLFNDLDAALERQTAMTDVLDAVSTARFDLQPVFDRVVEHAQRLCHDVFASSPSASRRHGRRRGGPTWSTSIRTSRIGRCRADSQLDDGHGVRHRRTAAHPRLGRGPPDLYPDTRAQDGWRTRPAHSPLHAATWPCIGVDRFLPCSAGGYTDDEISLLQTFTDQAAIAVDNARLLREIEQRNSELSESLELQTATSQILQLISDNPGNLDAVFQGIVAQAAHLCDADEAGIMRRDGDEFVVIDSSEPSATDIGDPGSGRRRQRRLPRAAVRRRPLGPVSRDADAAARSDGRHVRPVRRRRPLRPDQRESSRRSVRSSPATAGSCRRSPSRRRSPSPTPTCSTNSTRALERQTAMTDVLDAVSTARLDLQPVFDKVAEHADRLCRGTGAMVLGSRGRRPAPQRGRRTGTCRRRPGRQRSRTDRRVVDHRRGRAARRDRPHPRLGQRGRGHLRHFSRTNDGPPERAGRADDARRSSHRHHRVHPRRSPAGTPTTRSPSWRRSPTRPPSPSTTPDCSARSNSATPSCPSRWSCRRRRRRSCS